MKSDNLLWMILESVANDYEQLDHIANQVATWTETPKDQLDFRGIEATLADCISSGYIEAYELNSTAPQVVKVSGTANFNQHWFLITERGKARCSNTPE
jgi:hypothetical protein